MTQRNHNGLRPWLIATLLVCEACAFGSRRDAAMEAPMPSRSYKDSAGGAAPSAAAYEEAPAVEAAPAEPSAPGAPAQSPPKAQAAAPAVKRMLHYNGYAKLRVDAPRKAIDAASAACASAGGFVEAMSSEQLTLRVPVENFQLLYAELLKLGEVVEKAVTAQDVTDAFTSVELRLRAAKTSRDRLIALLARATTEREKLELLREISRLSQEINNLENASKTLAALAEYSRITLRFEERRQGYSAVTGEAITAFSWMARLAAFRRDVAFEQNELKLNVPEGFVALDDDEHFVAESADQAVLWTHRRDNVPKGDTAFWAAALKTRLGPEFKLAEQKVLGEFTLLRLVDRSDTPYVYLVGVRAKDDKLDVVEVHYPSEAHEQRYQAAVDKVIQHGKTGGGS